MEATACPSSEHLTALLVGGLSEKDAHRVEAHLEQCPNCVSLLTKLDASSTLIDELRDIETATGIAAGDQDNVASLIETFRTAEFQTAAGYPVTEGGLPRQSVASTSDSVHSFLSAPQEPDEIGRLGEYRVLRSLGRGGMGIVYEAEDLKLGRRVALKVMRPDIAANGAAQQRFLREAQAMASIKHDNIVTVHHVSEDRGVPFMTMELLEGESLSDRLVEGNQFPVDEVLRIGRQTAEGLIAAHEHGLIHRDVKPANLWIERETGRIKILDFGLARPEKDDVHLTLSGTIVGTPSYMSPEQGRGEPTDQRSDLFSLGSVLYRLCTGRAPFEGKSTMAVLTALSISHPQAVHHVRRDVPREMSQLIMQLLCKNPEDRPGTAKEVVARISALEEKLSRQTPAETGSPTTSAPSHQVQPVEQPHLRRRRLSIPALAAIAATLLLLVAVGIIRIYDRNRNLVGEHQVPQGGSHVFIPGDAQGRKSPLSKLTPQKNIPRYEAKVAGLGDPGKAPKELVAVIGSSRLRHWGTVHDVAYSPNAKWISSAGTDAVRAWDASTGEEVFSQGTEQLQSAHCVAFSPDGKLLVAGVHTEIIVWEVETWKERFRFKGHVKVVRDVVVTADSKRVASASDDRTIRIWDALTGDNVQVLRGHSDPVQKLAISPDGKLLASCVRKPDTPAILWDLATGKQQAVKSDIAHAASFSRDGKILAILDSDKVRLWDLTTKKFRDPIKAIGGTAALELSPDGKLLARGGHFGAGAHDLKTGELSHHLGSSRVPSVAFSPDSKWLVTATGNSVVVWNLANGSEVFPRVGHKGQLHSIMLHPRRAELLSVSSTGKLRIWSTETGEQLRALSEKMGPVRRIRLSRDGKRLSASRDSNNELATWEYPSGHVLCKQTYQGQIQVGTFSPDGERILVGGVGFLQAVDAKTGKVVTSFQPPSGKKLQRFIDLSYNHDGTLVVGSHFGEQRFTTVWDATTGKERWTLENVAADRVAFSPRGQLLAMERNSLVELWNAGTGKKVKELPRFFNSIQCLAFSPDGNRLVVADAMGKVITWEVGNWKRLCEWQFEGRINDVAFAGDSRHVATANSNGSIYVLRLPPPAESQSGMVFDQLESAKIPVDEKKAAGNGDPTKAPEGLVAVYGDSRFTHWDQVNDLDFSPDGRHVASASDDKTVRIWDLKTGRAVHVFRHPDEVNHLAYSPDGKVIATIADGKVSIFDVQSMKLVTSSAATGAVDFSSDAKHIAVGSGKEIHIIDTNTGQTISVLKGHEKSTIGGICYSPDGKLVASYGVYDKTARVWDAQTGKELVTFRGHANGVMGLAFKPDSKCIATLGQKGVKVWDARTGKQIRSIEENTPPYNFGIDFSPDGNWLVYAASLDTNINGVKAWNLQTGKVEKSFKVRGSVRNVRFSPDGKYVAAGTTSTTVDIWEFPSGKRVNPEGLRGNLTDVDVHPDGKLLLATGRSATVLWETANATQIARLPAAERGAAFSPDGKRIALINATANYSPEIWDTTSYELVLALNNGGRGAIAFSPDSSRLITALADAQVWDIANRKRLFELEAGKLGYARGMALSPDGRYLVMVHQFHAVRLWDLEAQKPVLTLPFPPQSDCTCCAYGPDGKRVACGEATGAIKLIELPRGNSVLSLKSHGTGVTSVDFSHDGKYFVSADYDGLIILWDATANREVRHWQFPGQVNRIRFTPDSGHLITANGNGTVYVLRLKDALKTVAK